MNNNYEQGKKNNDIKGISFVTVGILTIIVAIAGASFAFFQVSATNSNTIKGTSAYTANALGLTVSDKTSSTVGSKALIPQLNSAIKSAVNANGGCIDGNGSAICKVYEIVIKNNTTTGYYIDAKISFTASSMPNLKYQVVNSASKLTTISDISGVFTNGDASATAASTQSTFVNRVNYAASAEKYYYVVVWISEIGAAQTDSGSFTGTVQVDGYSSTGASTSGVTSTITS